MQAERIGTKVYQNSGSGRLGQKSRTIYAALSDSGRQVDGTAPGAFVKKVPSLPRQRRARHCCTGRAQIFYFVRMS